MHNFFDVNLFQQITSGLIVLIFSILLGGRTVKNSVNGKGWKIFIIFSWIMILGGFYLLSLNISYGGIYNPYVNMGLSIMFLGWIFKCIGKFFLWWHK